MTLHCDASPPKFLDEFHVMMFFMIGKRSVLFSVCGQSFPFCLSICVSARYLKKKGMNLDYIFMERLLGIELISLTVHAKMGWGTGVAFTLN